jgi:membrane protein DedA with SNARE-associated domain
MIFELSQIVAWLLKYRYFVLFPITLFEGPIITVIAGYFSSLNFFNFYVAYGVVVLGDTIGDLLYYAAGRWGRWRFLGKWGKLIDVEENRVAKMEKYFGRHAGKTLFFGKFGYGVVGTMLFASGMANVSLSRFLIFTFPATLIKSMLLLLVGFYFGYAYKQIALYLDYTSYIMIGIAVLLLLIYFYFQRRAKKILERGNNNTIN